MLACAAGVRKRNARPADCTIIPGNWLNYTTCTPRIVGINCVIISAPVVLIIT